MIKEKENLSLQLNAEQLKTNFDSCLIDDIVEWIATTDCISVHGETIEHEYLKEKFSKLTSQHIAYVIRNVKKHGKGINDKRAYYLAALYKSVDIEFNATKRKKEFSAINSAMKYEKLPMMKHNPFLRRMQH
ncbi:MAG: DUF6017 domain-containing protein [Ruminococcus callidus]